MCDNSLFLNARVDCGQNAFQNNVACLVLSDVQVNVQSQRPNIPLFLLEESMKLLLGRIFPVVSLLFLLTLSTHGVGTTGTLVGTVTDAKGGVISLAKVTVKN